MQAEPAVSFPHPPEPTQRTYAVGPGNETELSQSWKQAIDPLEHVPNRVQIEQRFTLPLQLACKYIMTILRLDPVASHTRSNISQYSAPAVWAPHEQQHVNALDKVQK